MVKKEEIIQVYGEYGKPNSSHVEVFHTEKEYGKGQVTLIQTDIGPWGGRNTHLMELSKETFDEIIKIIRGENRE